jgi:hypothetical protein
MADPKNNTKMTGDTHLPDTESEFSVEEANAQAAGEDRTPRDRGQAAERGDEARPGRGGKKAGVLGSGEPRQGQGKGKESDSR